MTTIYKPFKITDKQRSRRIGVVASDFRNLLTVGCEKLKISEDGVRIVLIDGTEVTDSDYLFTLPDHAVLIFLKNHEVLPKISEIITEFINLTKDLTGQTKIIELLQAYLRNDPDLNQKLQLLIAQTDINLADSKDDDPDWFEGVPTQFVSKERVLKENAARRIKSYLYKTKDDINKLLSKENSDKSCILKPMMNDIFNQMSCKLRKHLHHRGYFARSDNTHRLCDEKGKFLCQGEYNKKCCLSYHTINPYANKESRISLKTWNFDHVIERSRTIIPALIEACQIATTSNKIVNWKYFYSLLFTAEVNLKLVHHVCHILESHNDKLCDKNLYFSNHYKKIKISK